MLSNISTVCVAQYWITFLLNASSPPISVTLFLNSDHERLEAGTGSL